MSGKSDSTRVRERRPGVVHYARPPPLRSPTREALPIFARRGVRIGLGVVVGALMVLPAVITVAKLAGRSWFPVDDFGITYLRVRDVFTIHTPLTGLYSRPGWSHPGPLMFWLMAVIAAPFGGAAWAVGISGAVIQGGALGWLAWVTWRRGLRIFLAAATVTALSFLAFSPAILIQPWNPNIPLSCFILFLFLTLLAADGWFVQVLAMSVVGNVIVQTHIGYLAPVAACFAWVAACTVWDVRQHHRVPDRWKQTLLISAGVWIVVWLLPIVDVVIHWPGNLGKIAEYFVRGDHSRVGFGSATGIFGDEFRWVPNWLGAATRVTAYTAHAIPASRAWLLVPMLFLGLGFLAARRSRTRFDRRAVGLATLLCGVAVLAISSADEPRAYTFQWRAVLGAFVVVTCAWSVARALEPHVPRLVRALALVLVLALVGYGTISMSRAVHSAPKYGGLEVLGPALARVDAQLARRGVPRHRSVLVAPYGPGLPSLFDGVVDELDRRGVDVKVPPIDGRMFGEWRTARPVAGEVVWWVTSSGASLPDLESRPGARVIARTTPLRPAEEAEIRRLQQQVSGELASAHRLDLRTLLDDPLIAFAIASVPGIDRAAAARLAVLNRRVRARGCRCAVVAVPAS